MYLFLTFSATQDPGFQGFKSVSPPCVESVMEICKTSHVSLQLQPVRMPGEPLSSVPVPALIEMALRQLCDR